MASLLQSNLGGNFNGVTNGGTISTSAVGFNNPTTAGSLLILVGWITGQAINVNLPSSITTPGFTWSSGVGGGNWSFGGGVHSGVAFVYYIANAASMSITTKTIVNHFSLSNGKSVQMEFTLYEFSGIVFSSPVDKVGATNNVTGGTPNSNFATPTSATDLIIAVFSGDSIAGGVNISAGSGYTLGINATVAKVGQMQYKFDVPSGLSSATFGGGTEPTWGCGVVSFKETTSQQPQIWISS